jgi:exosortase C (VPDSG-CTERM-specific)
MTPLSNEAPPRDGIIAAGARATALVAPQNQGRKWRIWGAASFLVVVIAAFNQNLVTLMRYAVGSDLYSYILLVPFVSGYLLWIRRHQFAKNYTTNFGLAGVCFIAAVVLLVFSLASQNAAPEANKPERLALVTLSFLCCVAGGGFFFFGWHWMRSAAFPLVYLIFMVPMPDSMRDAFELASKSASAEVANLFFYLSGTPFLRQGPIFQLPNITIEVAQECSGIRSSLVLFMTSMLAANLFLKNSWRRAVLVAFVIPLGILRNGFRILVIGLLCANLGPQMIHSPIHTRGGPLFFALSMVPFLLLLLWLHRGEARLRAKETEPQ